VVPPRQSGALTRPLLTLLSADPADRPTMPQVRDELAALAAGRDGNTSTILLARTDLGSAAPGRTRTATFPAGAAAAGAAVAGAAAAGASPPPVAPPPTPVAAPVPAAEYVPAAAPPPAPPRPPRQQPPARQPGRR